MLSKEERKRRGYDTLYRKRHRKEIRKRQKLYYQQNKEAIYRKNRKWAIENRDRVKVAQKKWKTENKEYVLKKQRDYWRKHCLSTKNGAVYGLNKRDYTNYCELCGKERKTAYHHWDNENLNKGIWVCLTCHGICEAVEDNTIIQRYLEFKKILDKQAADEIFHHVEFKDIEDAHS